MSPLVVLKAIDLSEPSFLPVFFQPGIVRRVCACHRNMPFYGDPRELLEEDSFLLVAEDVVIPAKGMQASQKPMLTEPFQGAGSIRGVPVAQMVDGSPVVACVQCLEGSLGDDDAIVVAP